MMNFLINFNDSTIIPIVARDLSEAKFIAIDFLEIARVNHSDITIMDREGYELTESLWYNGTPEEEEFVLKLFSDGFYQMWTDEFAKQLSLLSYLS